MSALCHAATPILADGIIKITGIVLNQAYFTCSSCTTQHELFGSPASFRATAAQLGVNVLGELPLVPGVSESSDQGFPHMLARGDSQDDKRWKDVMQTIAGSVWKSLQVP